MKKIWISLALLLWSSHILAETITINARNWGPDSAAADAEMARKAAAVLSMVPGAETVQWLAHYKYDITDSTVWVSDWGQPDPCPVKRAFNPSNPEAECLVSPVWCIVTKVADTVEVITGDAADYRSLHAAPPEKNRFVKKGKITTSYVTYSTWQGGPQPTGIQAVSTPAKARLRADIAELRAVVDAKCRADKKLKRKDAWIATKKEKAEREKPQKPGKKK